VEEKMHKIFLLLLSMLMLVQAQTPERLKRADSFLGIHFDFHAAEDCDQIGARTDRQMIETILDMVKPDYVQIDNKGHRGYSSYPTRVGNPAPGFVGDQLKLWREVTAEHGVALFLHHSGVWDARALELHPEWARINENGEHDDRMTSVFGPYVDELLIPQLKELNDDYGVDGMWIDGECWAVERDWHDDVIKLFQKETGITTIPKKPGDPGWFEFSNFCRDGFRNYLEHYVDVLHAHNPDFQIASNWAYSSMMPEPVTIPVDFISGDFSAKNSVNSARIEGRAMVHQGKPWDLMAWSFTWTDGHYTTKTIPQLKQEAAMVLALGGGFQAYFPQKRDGSVRMWQMPLMKEVAEFCRARQEFCHKAEPVPQIGLIYSGKAFYRENKKLFSAWSGELNPLNGVLQALLNSQNVVDIVMEHHLTNRMSEYPVLIYPEWDTIEPEFKDQLIEYVENGGNLIVISPASAKLFEEELGVTLLDEPTEEVNGLYFNDWMGGVNSVSQSVVRKNDVMPFGKIYHADNTLDGESQIAASIRKVGKGKIAGVYLELGNTYIHKSTTVARDFLNGLVRELYPEPVVRVSGSHSVDVSLQKQNGRIAINLVNTAGPHQDERVNVFDDIPVVGPLSISLKVEKKPKSVWLEPAHRQLDYAYENGRLQVTHDRLEIHDIILVE
jgi:hypothetical protein